MEVIPAIDLKSGRCVRLYQGDYARETVFSDDPVAVALEWQEAGAPRVHVVDLDGAASGEPGNLDVIAAVARHLDVPLQVGGGIRRIETALGLLELGADRIVLGTAAVRDEDLVRRLCQEVGSDRVVVALDCRDGLVAVQGWTEGTSVTGRQLAATIEELGVGRFLYTDISRDGTLTQPNFDAIREMVAPGGRAILASGGVSSLDHCVRLAQIGVEGAILGRALYSGDIRLQEAIQASG